MRLFQNTLVSLLITASIIIAGITVFFLSVRGRPDASSDIIAQADAAQGQAAVAQETPVVLPVPEMTIVEGTTIILSPQAGELVQRADSVPVPQVIIIDPTPDPNVVIIDTTVQGDGGVPTITPSPPVPTPITVVFPTVTPFPTTAPVVSAADPLVAPIIFANHVVVAGETLYSIARDYNSAVELLAARGISSEDLVPGATISIPYPNPAFCPNMKAYVVREKDTVFRIASVNGVSVDSIRNTNGLGPDFRIDIAQVLCIPPS